MIEPLSKIDESRKMARGQKTGGRQKGTPNRVTATAKEAFQLAFEELGGVPALTKWAKGNQDTFYKLYARLIPMQQEISGPEGDPVEIRQLPATDDWLKQFAIEEESSPKQTQPHERKYQRRTVSKRAEL